ncbi:ABC transporter permease [Pseudorhodoferax sp. LjRoot39]|uniref:ABC transporter permease n=1 Tax=Pseudorhodoferax sp. LjRoot39 TaxID=3342328 RepID=UPI003ECCCF53
MSLQSALLRLYRRIERAIVPVALLIGWEVFSRSGVLPPALLPAPSQVLVAWADWVFATDGNTQTYSGKWIQDVAASASRVFAGFAISTVLGIAIGMAIGWSRTVERLIEPVLQILRPVPPVSWIPLAIIWFGIANKPAIFLVFLGSFFPVLLSTIHGVKTCDRNLLRAGAMAGGAPGKLLRHIVFPAALPSIFSGLRIAIGSAWMLTVTAEMVAVKSGVGYVLWDSYYFLRYDIVIASMVSIGLLGFLSDLAIKLFAGRVLRWQRGSTLQAKEA